MLDAEKKLKNLPEINYKLVLSGFDKQLEDEFSKSLAEKSLKLIRFSLISGIVVYFAFGIIDNFIDPLNNHLSWLICLFFIFSLAVSFTSYLKKIIRIYSLINLIITALGIFFVLFRSQDIDLFYSICFAGLIFIIAAAYSGMCVRFIYAPIIGITAMIVYEIIAINVNKIFFIDNGINIFINNNFFLLLDNVLGIAACFFIEYTMRHSFLLAKKIQYQEEINKIKAEQEVLQANKERDYMKNLDILKNNFVANVTHEIRTPLTLILGPLEVMLSKENSKDVRLKTMYYNGMKLLNLINNILDFSKIDAGKIKVKKQKIRISELLRFYVDTVKASIENLNININFIDNAGTEIIAYTDKNLLEKAIFNLISNSLKFTPKGGSITVKLDNKENSYYISVEDTGVGIPEDKLESIFERFNQLVTSDFKKYEGTGIGLALTKELVESLGGKIFVKSKLNEGSTFTIILPNEKIEADTETDKNYFEIKQYLLPGYENRDEYIDDDFNKYVHGGQTILVVEDNPNMQKYIKSILCENYNVNTAKNGKEGLEKIYAAKPDLILADVMMPEMDGYEMTEIIKSTEELKGIPVILLTAKSEMYMKIKGFVKGADDYIVKPFNTEELLARVNAHLEIKRLRDETIKQKEDLEKTLNEKIIAQRHLEESEKRFKEMAENLPVSIIESDLNNNILYLNKYTKQLFNISKQDNLQDFIDTAGNEKFFNNLKNLYKNGMSELCECKLNTSNGSNMTALVKSIVLFDQDKPKGIRSTIMEIEPNYNILLMPDKNFCVKYNITERENDIIILLIKGLTYTQIGEKLFISYKTVDTHIFNIYKKTNVNNRNQLVELIQNN